MSRILHSPVQTLFSLKMRHEYLNPQKENNSPEAIYFIAEQSAWILIEAANLTLYTLRWGVPKNETHSFDLLQEKEILSLEEARHLKQRLEFRNLSHRDIALLSPNEVLIQFSQTLPLVSSLFTRFEALLKNSDITTN